LPYGKTSSIVKSVPGTRFATGLKKPLPSEDDFRRQLNKLTKLRWKSLEKDFIRALAAVVGSVELSQSIPIDTGSSSFDNGHIKVFITLVDSPSLWKW
jgi:hypothetical protein